MMKEPTLAEEIHMQILESFLAKRGVFYERIEKRKKYKTPDYSLFKMPYTFLGELKAPGLRFNKKLGVYSHLTKVRKLREAIKKSSEQFTSIDSFHTKPRVLIFSSSHPQFHGKNLAESIFAEVHGNNFKNDKIVLDTNFFLSQIDLIIWLQVSPDETKAYQATYALNSKTKHKKATEYLLSVLKAKPVSTMDQAFDY